MSAPQFAAVIHDLIPDCERHLTVEALLRRLVAATCRAHEMRETERRAVLPVSLEKLLGQLGQGRAGVADLPPAHPVMVESATADAIDAFRDGLILLFVEGQRCAELDAPLHVTPHTRMLLVRRMMLRG